MKKGRKPNANEAQLHRAMREGMDKTMVFCVDYNDLHRALVEEQGLEW